MSSSASSPLRSVMISIGCVRRAAGAARSRSGAVRRLTASAARARPGPIAAAASAPVAPSGSSSGVPSGRVTCHRAMNLVGDALAAPEIREAREAVAGRPASVSGRAPPVNATSGRSARTSSGWSAWAARSRSPSSGSSRLEAAITTLPPSRPRSSRRGASTTPWRNAASSVAAPARRELQRRDVDDVEHAQPAGSQDAPDLQRELHRREMRGHERAVEGVDDDRVGRPLGQRGEQLPPSPTRRASGPTCCSPSASRATSTSAAVALERHRARPRSRRGEVARSVKPPPPTWTACSGSPGGACRSSRSPIRRT